MAKGTLEVGGTAEGGKMASLEVEQSATGGVAGALIVDNNDTDKQAMVIEAANIDADVLDITMDAVTTAKGIDITADALTTGSALYIDSDSSSTASRNIATIIQNHSSASGSTTLYLQNDHATADALLAKGAVTVGVDDIGHDVKFFGATSGKSLLWDESADELLLAGTMKIKEQAAADADTAAYGQIWVDDAVKSPLMYTNDAGDDIGITTGSTLNAASLGGVLPSGVTGGSGLTALGTVASGTLDANVVNNITSIGFSGQLDSAITGDGVTFTYSATEKFISGVTESSGTITAPTAGKYWMFLTMMTQTGSEGGHWVKARIHIEGAALLSTTNIDINLTSQTYHQTSIGGVFDLDADDEVFVNSNINGTNQIFAGQVTRFSMYRIGA